MFVHSTLANFNDFAFLLGWAWQFFWPGWAKITAMGSQAKSDVIFLLGDPDFLQM